MKAVILAGGKGSRMKELTENLPKAMLPIQEKPMLQVIIENIREAGIKDFVVLVSYKKEKIINYFGNGDKLDVKIEYAYQEEPKGTADALGCVEELIEDDLFFMIHGDVIIETDEIKDILERKKPLICLKKVNDPRRFGVVEIKNEKVSRIVEKSENPPSNLINTGVFLLPREIFDAIKETPISERGEFELTDSLEIMINKGIDLGYHILEETTDIGTKEIYIKNKD